MRVGVTEARLALGFVILPPADAVLAFFMHRALWPENPWEVWAHPHGAATLFAFEVAVASVFVTAVAAIVWMLTRGLSLKRTLLLGFALGNAPYFLIVMIAVCLVLIGAASPSSLRYTAWSGPWAGPRMVVVGSVVGTLSSLLFWLVAVGPSRE